MLVAVTLALAALVGVGYAKSAGAWAIVRAPNHDGAVAAQTPPPDVVGVIRAEVGPPAATLEAWILEDRSGRSPRGTALVLHGIRDDKSSMVGVGRSLAARGLRAILVDLRGHGASTGRWLTYGVVESQDLVRLIDQLEALGVIRGPVSIYGPSYGGAVALQTAARDPRVRAVVSLSTFASLRAVVPPYADRIPVIGAALPDALIDSIVDDAGELGGFSPDAADTVAAIARTDARVLLVHGERDGSIPFEHAEALRDACGSQTCELLPIPGADHAGTLRSALAVAAAVDFLARWGTDASPRHAPARESALIRPRHGMASRSL